MNEQQSQNLLLKVDPLSTIRNNKLNTQGEKFETAKLRVLYWIYHHCLQLKRQDTAFCFLYFGALRTQRKIFILFCSAHYVVYW